jgi:3-hydroxyisobutyrate dehydrogenase-like beta-hydroxyacid dehydrogenase
MKVGFIGLGRMGQAMAARILGGSHELVVYNRSREKAAELQKNGAKVAGSIAEACRGREVVISMVSDDKALTEVVKEISAALDKGAIHVAMGTHGVHVLREVDAVHGKLGQKFVASPVLGRPEAAAAGQINIVPAGPADAIEKVAPLNALMGRRTFPAGTKPEGAAAVKLANNMLIGCAIEAMGEAFSLVRKYGVDPAAFYEVFTDGLFSAPAYKVYGNIIAKELYNQVGFTTALGLKDTGLMLAAGLAENVPLPSLNVYRDKLLAAMANGDENCDWAVMARHQARAAGLDK